MGVGGAGGNAGETKNQSHASTLAAVQRSLSYSPHAVNNMIANHLQGVDFLVCNTDAQHLSTCLTSNCIQLGREHTKGLGCGANPQAGYHTTLTTLTTLVRSLGDPHLTLV